MCHHANDSVLNWESFLYVIGKGEYILRSDSQSLGTVL